MKVRVYQDPRGYPRAEIDPPCLALDLFLLHDVQGISHCREILEHIDAVRSGMEITWGTAGNASRLTLHRDGAHIENEFAIPRAFCDLSLDDMRLALAAWLAFLEGECHGREG